MPEQSTIRRAAAIVAGARPQSSPTTAAHPSAVKECYGLGRRVLALLLGIQLPVPPREDPTPAAPVGPQSVVRADATSDDERDDYGMLLHVLKEYVAAEPAERLRQRPHALEYLKDLNGLLKITEFDSRFRHSLTVFTAMGHRSVSYPRLSAHLDFPGLDQHHQFVYSIHRDAVHEVRDRLDSFRWRTKWLSRERLIDFDALQVLLELRSSTEDPDQLFTAWRQHIPVDAHYVIPREKDLGQIIDWIEADPGEPIARKLEEVRDALAVASHDFIGDDLSGADIKDIPLGGVHWSPATTTWPSLWRTTIADASVPVEPGIYRVDDDVTIRD
jgi:hypothetical protein